MKYTPRIVTAYWRTLGIPEPELEHRFHPERKWRFDFAWPQQKVALEVEGGVWTYGRHNRASGFLRDMEKYNRAAVLGWRVLRVTPKALLSPATVAMLKGALSNENELGAVGGAEA